MGIKALRSYSITKLFEISTSAGPCHFLLRRNLKKTDFLYGMSIQKIAFWILIWFPPLMIPGASLLAQNQGARPAPPELFQPDFSGKPAPLPKGTPLRPLCAHPGSPSCLPQWSHQARPLAVHSKGPAGQVPQHEYFMPAFIPSSGPVSINPVGNPQWRQLTLPMPRLDDSKPKRRRSRSRRRGYSRSSSLGPSARSSRGASPASSSSNEGSSDSAKQEAGGSPPQADEDGSAALTDPAPPAEAPEDAVQAPDSDDSPENVGDEAEVKTDFYASRNDASQVVAVTTQSDGVVTMEGGTVAFVATSAVAPVEDSPPVAEGAAPAEDGASPAGESSGDTAPSRRASAPPAGGSAESRLSEDAEARDPEPNKGDPEAPQEARPAPPSVPTYETVVETVALPATLKKAQEGCFVLDKKPESETEASFCFFCDPDNLDDNDSVLSRLLSDGEGETLRGYLSQAVSGYGEHKGASGRAFNQITGSNDSPVEKICSPETSLKSVISNFERTCAYEGGFEKLFEDILCRACKKAIPPEIMMAMMSAESSGRCDACNSNDREYSLGLFQVNAQAHGCYSDSGGCFSASSSNSTGSHTCGNDKKIKNTGSMTDNERCLLNPLNNMAKSMEILFDHYEQVNPHAPDQGRCLERKPSACLSFMENDSASCGQGNCPSWNAMTPDQREFWRRGVAAYNAGPSWIRRAIQSAREMETLDNTCFLSRKENLKYKNDSASWEQVRVYFFIEKLSPGLSGCIRSDGETTTKTGRLHNNTLSNIAHTEAVLGREFETSYPPLVEVWAQYKEKFIEENGAPSCP